jgi:hypothetical protein
MAKQKTILKKKSKSKSKRAIVKLKNQVEQGAAPVKVFKSGKKIGLFESIEAANKRFNFGAISKENAERLKSLFPTVLGEYVVCLKNVKFNPKNSLDLQAVINIDTTKKPELDLRGGRRKGAGAKPLTASKKRRGFYCWVTETKAMEYGNPKIEDPKQRWRDGLRNIQALVQKSVHKDL